MTQWLRDFHSGLEGDVSEKPRYFRTLRRIFADQADVFAVLSLLFLKAAVFPAVAGLSEGSIQQWKTDLATILLCTGWLVLLKPPLRRPILLLVDVLLSALAIGDLWYMRYFSDVLCVSLWVSAGNALGIRHSIAAVMQPVDVIFFLDCLVIPLAWWLRPAPAPALNPLRSRTQVFACLMALGVLTLSQAVYTRISRFGAGLYVDIWSQPYFVRVNGLPFFHAQDCLRFAWDHVGPRPAPSPQKFAEARAIYAQLDVERAQGPRLALHAVARSKNVIHLQLEAFQAHLIGLNVQGQAITPNLNMLADESIYVHDFYHQTAQGRTSDAEWTTLCGLQPLAVGSVFFRFAQFQQQCLPAILQQNGYQTVAYHANDSAFWNRLKTYPRLGIERFVAKTDFVADDQAAYGLSDGSFLRQVLADLKRQKAPFFAHIVTLSSHHPFQLPKAMRTLELGALDAQPVGDYLQAVHYVDEQVGIFIAGLRQAGLLDSSVIVVFGDHDKGPVTDKAATEQVFGPIDGNELRVLDWSRRVPLSIRLPNARVRQQIVGPAGNLDIAPTLLHLLGISAMNRDFLGHNLLDPAPHTVAFRSGAAVDATHYLAPPQDAAAARLCIDRRSENAVPLAACATVAAGAVEQLEFSDWLIRSGQSRATLTNSGAAPSNK